MVKHDFHTLFLRSASLVWLLCAGVAVVHGGEAFPRGDSTAAVARDARRQPALSQNPTQAFIRLGEMVAERDVALFSTDLLSTYKVLKGDKRNLTWLFERCDRNWGATAYALALQAASPKLSLREVVMCYDLAGRNWQQTAVDMGAVSRRSGEPTYTFGAYLNRQQQAWEQVLEAPLRWRRTFLNQ